MIVLVYCILSLFNCMFVLSPALCDILLTSMAGYSLVVLKVLLNTKQANEHSYWRANVKGLFCVAGLLSDLVLFSTCYTNLITLTLQLCW